MWKQRELLREFRVACFKVGRQNMSLEAHRYLLSLFLMAIVLYSVFWNLWHVDYTTYAWGPVL